LSKLWKTVIFQEISKVEFAKNQQRHSELVTPHSISVLGAIIAKHIRFTFWTCTPLS